MAHAFHAIGNTAKGETVLAVFPVVDDAQAAFDQAEKRCEAHRQERATTHKPYAYVLETGYPDQDETAEERQERAAAEQARLAELIAADPCRPVPLARPTKRKAQTFELRLETGNASFDDDARGELVATLLRVAAMVENGESARRILDANGNRIGSFAWTERLPRRNQCKGR